MNKESCTGSNNEVQVSPYPSEGDSDVFKSPMKTNTLYDIGLDISPVSHCGNSNLNGVISGDDSFSIISPKSEMKEAKTDLYHKNAMHPVTPKMSCKKREFRSEGAATETNDNLPIINEASSGPEMRQKLLIHRALAAQEDPFSFRCSSPRQKMKLAPTAICHHTPNIKTPRKDSPSEALISQDAINEDPRILFKTPVRTRRLETFESTPSIMTTPLQPSPVGSSVNCTPGRQCYNPFEVNYDRLHFSMVSPGILFSHAGRGNTEEESCFWSVDHTANLMPAVIRDSEIKRQFKFENRRDVEKELRTQQAIDTFFSNELIVPSPWAEKVENKLRLTPKPAKSVSCQTTVSVPMDVDFLSILKGNFILTAKEINSSDSPETVCGTYIRRRLELKDDDFTSPVTKKAVENESPSGPSQTTPEWEAARHGHFSSSPIKTANNFSSRKYMSGDIDLLASPELSPIACRDNSGQRSFQNPDVLSEGCEEQNPKTIMQLDFSSILDDPEELDKEKDTTGVFEERRNTSTDYDQPASGRFSIHLSESYSGQNCQHADGGSSQAFVSSVISDMHNEMTTTTSQDTGYQTSSLFSSNNDRYLQSRSSNHDFTQASLAPCSNSSLSLSKNLFFSNLPQETASQPFEATDKFRLLSSDSSKENVIYSADDMSLYKDSRPLRKVRVLGEKRMVKEKSSVSRDLSRSFNEEAECLNLSGGSKHKQSQKDNSLNRFITLNTIENKHKLNISQNLSDVSMRSSSPRLNLSGDVISDLVVPELSNSETNSQIQFSITDDNTLMEARKVLNESEKFRMQTSNDYLSDPALCLEDLEDFTMASFQSKTSGRKRRSYGKENHTSNININCNSASDENATSFTSILDKLEKRIDSVNGGKLGSEIAAEILRRANEDLALLETSHS